MNRKSKIAILRFPFWTIFRNIKRQNFQKKSWIPYCWALFTWNWTKMCFSQKSNMLGFRYSKYLTSCKNKKRLLESSWQEYQTDGRMNTQTDKKRFLRTLRKKGVQHKAFLLARIDLKVIELTNIEGAICQHSLICG